MSSSLSELRNFRLNKGNASVNGANPSSKLATGRKRIRAMSDSSDDEHAKKQTTPPQKTTQNGTTVATLTTKDKEERFRIFRDIVDPSVDGLILQDFLVQNGWDVQKAYDALQENPNYKNSGKHSTPDIKSSPSVSTNHSLNASVEVVREQKHKQNKVKSIQLCIWILRSISNDAWKLNIWFFYI